jgi:hypothetical protein
VYNPKNLEIKELPQSASNCVSFISKFVLIFNIFLNIELIQISKKKVNTQNAGVGELKSYASTQDGLAAFVEQYQLDKFIYSLKIYAHQDRASSLNLFLEYQP